MNNSQEETPTKETYSNCPERETVSSVWHPFTQSKIDPSPIKVSKASGSLIYDTNGKSYIDAVSSWWVNIHGHAHPHITNAIKEQLDKMHQVIFAGCTHEPAELLTKRLSNIIPIEKPHFFFSDNGSTAIEVALKISIQYAKQSGQIKNRFLALEDSYHGDTFGAMSVSESGYFTDPFSSFLFPTIKIPHPAKDFEKCIRVLQAECEKGDVLALIYEPLVQGASGMNFYEPKHLEEILKITSKHKVLNIADEIFTGFGRTGTLFASEQTNIKPDIICLSKALTGGTLPLGLTITKESIWEKFYSDKREHMLLHGHSFTGNPLSCTAALASLDLVERDDFKLNLSKIMDYYEKIKPEVSTWENVTKVRNKGLIFALDIEAKDKGYGSQIKNKLYPYFLEEGVLLRPLGNVIYLVPPVCISNSELDKVFSTIKKSLKLIS